MFLWPSAGFKKTSDRRFPGFPFGWHTLSRWRCGMTGLWRWTPDFIHPLPLTSGQKQVNRRSDRHLSYSEQEGPVFSLKIIIVKSDNVWYNKNDMRKKGHGLPYLTNITKIIIKIRLIFFATFFCKLKLFCKKRLLLSVGRLKRGEPFGQQYAWHLF